jgi:G-protein signaling modulator 2
MYKLSLTELASEGERLCKLGDCASGVRVFEAAIDIYNQQIREDINKGIIRSDQEEFKLLQTMSIVYNQLGNGYFYLQDYNKALEYHKKDLEISELFGDEAGKAKACGNIGNTLQLLGDYDEAILYSLRNLEISRNLNDAVTYFFTEFYFSSFFFDFHSN